MASVQNPAAPRPPAPRPVAAPQTGRKRPPGPLKIADAYLLTQVIEATLRGLLWFGGLLFMVAVITAVKRVVNNGIGMGAMFNMVLYQTPRIVLFALPMSVLYGVVQAFTELSTESEITALAAGGMSLPRMMRAPLCFGAVLAVFAFILQETVVPGTQLRVDSVMLSSIGVTGTNKKFQWVDPPIGKGPTKRLILADRLDLANGTLIRPRIQILNETGQPKVLIEAESGKWDLKSNNWKFYNGSSTVYGRGMLGNWVTKGTSRFNVLQNDDVQAPAFGKLSKSSPDAHSALDAYDYEKVSIWQVIDYRREKFEEKQTAKNEEDRATAKEQVKSATFGIHDKIATAIVVLAMVLAGAPLGLRPPRSKGQGVAMGISLAVLILYYVTWSWCTAVGKNGHGNPVLFAYMSPLLTFAAGLVLVAKKSR